MLMHQPLKKADLILVLGNCDTRVAEYAAQLYLDGWAPVILFTTIRLPSKVVSALWVGSQKEYVSEVHSIEKCMVTFL